MLSIPGLVARLTAATRRTHRQNSTSTHRSSSESGQHGGQARRAPGSNNISAVVIAGLITHAWISGPPQHPASRQAPKENEQGGQATRGMESRASGNLGRAGHPKRTDHPQNKARELASAAENAPHTHHTCSLTRLPCSAADTADDV